MRTSAKTLLQAEQYQTKASFVGSIKAAFIRLGTTQVSHRLKSIASPVKIQTGCVQELRKSKNAQDIKSWAFAETALPRVLHHDQHYDRGNWM
jgi:hypothetical protein